jgi:hypothetical protein
MAGRSTAHVPPMLSGALQGEAEDAYRVRLQKERVLALSPTYVPE